MNPMLRNYIDEMFIDAPQGRKTVEMKEEILQNLTDRYNDLLADGKSEDAAFNIAVAGLGDFSELIAGLRTSERHTGESYDAEQLRLRTAIFSAVAIGMYILCVIPVLFFNGPVGIAIMFVMIAVATGLLVFNGISKPRYLHDDTMAEEFKEWRESTSHRGAVLRAINSAVWSVTVGIYLLISFWSGAWHITWIIFLIASSLTGVVKALYDLKGGWER